MKKVIGIMMVLTFVLLSTIVIAKNTKKLEIDEMVLYEPTSVTIHYGYPHTRYVVITEHEIDIYQQDFTGYIVQTHNIVWDNPFFE